MDIKCMKSTIKTKMHFAQVVARLRLMYSVNESQPLPSSLYSTFVINQLLYPETVLELFNIFQIQAASGQDGIRN